MRREPTVPLSASHGAESLGAAELLSGGVLPTVLALQEVRLLSSSENNAELQGCVGSCCRSGHPQAQHWTRITLSVPLKDLLSLTENPENKVQNPKP